ncbi:MAG: mechanosensitive ion channel protein MscS, partial [Sulfuritalea sp.]|nr:mechanosensitive ion channel protein MscS [Sulfuritalea sp.]
MNESELTALWRIALSDLSEPDLVWQLLAVGCCLLLAYLGEQLLSRRQAGAGLWELGRGGLLRVAFPMLGLLFVTATRSLVEPWMHIGLFSLAIPLLSSLAVIRMVFYVLRFSFVGAKWLASSERIFAMLVWGVVALHITGFLPEVIHLLESVSFNVGVQKLTLWRVLQGLVLVMVTVLLAMWLGSVIEARLNSTVGLDRNLRLVFGRLAKALLLVLGVLIVLPLVGIDLTTLSV